MSIALAPDEVRPVEQRAEVECLGDLQARRRQLLVNLAPLKALHGPGGKWEAKRSQLSRAMRIKARMALIAEGNAKPTAEHIEALAGADPQYAEFIDDGIAGAIAYVNLQNEYDELAERIRSREVELLVYNSEAKLAR